jgi:Kef-type K+ transport system membrane component KefB
MVGAFLAGAVMDAEWFGPDDLDRFRRFLLLAVMPVFFLSTGLRTNWSLGGAVVLLAAAVLTFAAVGGKLIGAQITGRILGWTRAEAAIIGWLLQAKGRIMIVFVNVLLDKQLISSETFMALLLMAVASTMVTVPRVAPLLRGDREIVHKSA